MVSRAEFTGIVSDAYKHLYDLVGLRTHPLTGLLLSDPNLQGKDKAWQLHRLLLQTVEELNPGPHAPTFSHEWRRHRLVVLRYVDGLDAQTVAQRLSIGRRQYYREYEAALEAAADVLWQRYVAPRGQAAPQPQPSTAPAAGAIGGVVDAADRLGLLRLEAARTAQVDRYVSLTELVPGVLSLLQERAQHREVRFQTSFPDDLPTVSPDRNLLRQMLLAMLGYLVERAAQATISLQARQEGSNLLLALRVQPPEATSPTEPAVAQERVATLNDLAALCGVQVRAVQASGAIAGFDLQLSARGERTVLVVDDNEDVLVLFQGYLGLHRYRVVTAQTSTEALALARQLLPYAITLDLMMPGRDGWDVLQTLLHQPDTGAIPVIVCSVLREKELALSLGATAFLEKPISRQALLDVLEAIGRHA